MKTEKKDRLQKPGRTTIRLVDVAHAAGCSTATVSRVQNSPDSVSPQVRDRVHAAIRKLGYMPNSAARALRSHRSRMIGIVIPTLSHAIYACFVDAVQRRVTERGYSLLVATFEYDLDDELSQARVLIERGAEAVILVGEQHRAELHRLIEAAGIPHINSYIYDADSDRPSIGIDNERAAFDVTQFLLGLGHRDIGVVLAATRENDRAAARLAGIRAALRQNGLELGADRLIEQPYGIDGGRQAGRELLSGRPAPSAVIGGNDILAFGVLIACRELGLGVPEDVSIVGFDNLEFTPHLDPPLTTMEVPAADMGRGAVDYLFDRLSDRPVQKKIRLEPKLIARRSTGIAPGVAG
ncbi:MAG: LacI family DNA-binding transcriptional regulator [Alphaproteobacteria bacterium]